MVYRKDSGFIVESAQKTIAKYCDSGLQVDEKIDDLIIVQQVWCTFLVLFFKKCSLYSFIQGAESLQDVILNAMKDCYGESLRNFGNETMKKLTDSTTKFATLFTDLTTAVGSRKVIDD